MKIGFDAKRAFNNASGLGNFSRNSIAALAGRYPDNQHVLFRPDSKSSLFVAPENSVDIQPEGFWWKTMKSAWRSFQISNLSRKLHLDVYHGLSHELPLGIEHSGVKSVVTIHDLIYLRYSEFFKRMDRNIYNLKFRHACRVADRIHAISEQTKLDLIRYYQVPETKIQVIYQAVNPLFYRSTDVVEKQSIRTKYHLPEKFILTVGTVEPRKNLLTLLQAMVSAKISIQLVVVGKPTAYQRKIDEFLANNKSLPEVIFLSGISDAELAVFYQLAEIMIYPSLFEGFGLPVAEAQASGCAVITSKTSSLPEAGGDAAWYIDPENPDELGQAIAGLVTNQQLRDTMIAKGRKNAQRFLPENYAKQMNELYKSVINA